jgi:hypothetical protein
MLEVVNEEGLRITYALPILGIYHYLGLIMYRVSRGGNTNLVLISFVIIQNFVITGNVEPQKHSEHS